MELEKVTASRERWYDDACGTAHALELVGERWSLLVMRELMFGARRFTELKRSLPGVSANVLTQRLDGLERAGLLTRRTLPPPANVPVYELTNWGYEAGPVIRELGRWAARSPRHDPTLPLSPVSLMMSFQTMFAADRAKDVVVTLGFRLGPDRFEAAVADGTLGIRRGDAEGAEATVVGAPEAMAAHVYGGVPLEELEKAGALAVKGDRAAVARFACLFSLPPKAVG